MSTDVAFEQYPPALSVHCYRMLGSVVDAKDAVQEAMLRACKNRDGFAQRSSIKPWMYRIATNVCMDMLSASDRQRMRPRDLADQPGTVTDDMKLPQRSREYWVEPIPDVTALAAEGDSDPAERAILRESIRLAFIAALQ